MEHHRNIVGTSQDHRWNVAGTSQEHRWNIAGTSLEHRTVFGVDHLIVFCVDHLTVFGVDHLRPTEIDKDFRVYLAPGEKFARSQRNRVIVLSCYEFINRNANP